MDLKQELQKLYHLALESAQEAHIAELKFRAFAEKLKAMIEEMGR